MAPNIKQEVFRNKTEALLCNLERYHQAFKNAFAIGEAFGGPSLYFHLEALSAKDWDRKVEMTYAALVSWGMHRMGPRGAKMKSFQVFKESLTNAKTAICEATSWEISDVNNCQNNWGKILEIFKSINVMESETILVGNSKVMAHLLPNLVSPIDRTYTMKFLRGNTDINNDRQYQSILFTRIMKEVFYPIVYDERFVEFNKTLKKSKWDTSPLKIIDNIIIGNIVLRRNGI